METNAIKIGRTSKISCCVVGCSNNYTNTTSNVKFYNFPNRWYEAERKKIWINSVKRIRAGQVNELWQPKTHDKVCSVHFVGNQKANNPLSPSYNPTIFPKKSSQSHQTDNKCQVSRFVRHMARAKKQDIEKVKERVNEENLVSNNLFEEDNKTSDFQCQTEFESVDSEIFVFSCDFTHSSTEVAVQTNIPQSFSNNFISFSDKCVGNNDDINCNGFHGYASIKSDKALSSLGGVTFDTFNLLLSYLFTSHGNCKLTEKNYLLLFLMKLKLGLSFTCLSVLFDVHPTTVSRQFIKVLHELRTKMSNFIYWPSRDVIDITMPETFKVNYPKCRAIIDCSEIRIEQPNKIDDRVFTYSHYKGTFTAKFLIAIAPNGFITFVSKCYGGRSSDAFITNDSGFLSLLEAEDLVLADKGFPGIQCRQDAIVVVPPFVHEGRLSLEEIEQTYTIASVRIHVERSIQRVKTFNILQKVPSNLFPYLDNILYMCCALTNLQPPTIAECYDD